MNILICGLGSIAGKHVHAIRLLRPESRFFALRSSQDAPVVSGIQNVFGLGELPCLPDFVIISNPTALHLDAIEVALPLGVPLFIEKPLSHSLNGIESLSERCIAEGIKTYVACNLRFHPCIQYVKALLENETTGINEVNVYAGSYLPSWRPERDFRKTYSARTEMGGGVHLDLIHELDYACWLFGLPLQTYRVLRSNSTLDIPAVDSALYHFRYPRFNLNITLNYFRRDEKREVEILLQDRTITADLVRGEVRNGNKLLLSTRAGVDETYIEQMRYFIDVVMGGGTGMNDIAEAYEVLKICLQ